MPMSTTTAAARTSRHRLVHGILAQSTLRRSSPTPTPHLVRAYPERQALDAAIPVAEAETVAAEAELTRLQREADLIAQWLEAARAEEENITAQVDADTDRAGDIRAAVGQIARDTCKGDMAESALSAALDAQRSDDFLRQSALADTALRTQAHGKRSATTASRRS